jgi:hypothetical protein
MALAMLAPPLVWRTPLATAPTTTSASPGLVDAPARQAEAHTVAAPPALSTETPVALSPTLDPTLVERMTDDVIRRIDYRMRIERERRGL